jgi:hypothetical protein
MSARPFCLVGRYPVGWRRTPDGDLSDEVIVGDVARGVSVLVAGIGHSSWTSTGKRTSIVRPHSFEAHVGDLHTRCGRRVSRPQQ